MKLSHYRLMLGCAQTLKKLFEKKKKWQKLDVIIHK